MQFSNSTTNQGIVEQTRAMMRVDATQYPTARIVASCNNWLDTITGYAIGADRRFQWDDTNHTALPIGTTNLVSGQADYSFLTDEQGNAILNLIGIFLLEITTNIETRLYPTDINSPEYNFNSFGINTATPTRYDKIADNIIRLDNKPSATDATKYKIKFYFQRTPSYFTATDTTKQPGVAPIIHRGFIIASAYDGALSLGLTNLQPLSIEILKETQKMQDYFTIRETDEPNIIIPRWRNPR